MLNLRHVPFHGGYSVGVTKYVLQELYKGGQVCEPYLSVLPNVLQDLAQGGPAQAVDGIQYLQLLIGKTAGFVSNYYPELGDPVSQLSLVLF